MQTKINERKFNYFQLVCAYPDGECEQKNYSAFLESLNNDATREADHIYAMWSDGNKNLFLSRNRSD